MFKYSITKLLKNEPTLDRGRMAQEIIDDVKKEAREAIRVVTRICLDIFEFTALLLGAWILDNVIEILGYQSEYWVKIMNNYAHPVVFLSFFTLSSSRIIALVGSPFKKDKDSDELQEPVIDVILDDKEDKNK